MIVVFVCIWVAAVILLVMFFTGATSEDRMRERLERDEQPQLDREALRRMDRWE